MQPLKGKIAVVAGATRGAGRGIACMLGAAGATVYCTGRSVRGQPAMPRIALPTGADVASTWPVMMINDICSVNGIRSQNPLPHASTTSLNDDGVQVSAAANTMKVASSAKMKASGIHFSVQVVRRIAARATIPGSSAVALAEADCSCM